MIRSIPAVWPEVSNGLTLRPVRLEIFLNDVVEALAIKINPLLCVPVSCGSSSATVTVLQEPSAEIGEDAVTEARQHL